MSDVTILFGGTSSERRVAVASGQNVIAPGVIHKTEVGGMRLGLRGAQQVRAAAMEMTRAVTAIGQSPTGFLVQRMAAGGVVPRRHRPRRRGSTSSSPG